jgi:fluoride ion exporter CrcB/FEX
MLEAQRLGEDGDFASMGVYLAASVVGGLAMAGLGWALGGALG